MDFGWKKPDPVQEDKVEEAASSSNTPVASTSDPASSGQEETTVAKPLIGSDFSVSKDDSFDDDKPELETPAPTDINNMDSSSAPEFAEPTIDTQKTAEKDESNEEPAKPAATETRTEDSNLPKVDEEDEKLPEPAPIVAESAVFAKSSGQSLADFESKIKAEKEEVSQKLTDLQDKATKLDDLLAKIEKMLSDEQSLIQEISSAIE